MVEKYLFKIDKERWEALIKLRNWKHPIVELARRTNLTKSYISQVINGGAPLSHEFMLLLIKVTGNDPTRPEEWAGLFKVESEPVFKKAPQSDNYRKYRGEVPYRPYSLAGQIRKRDQALNLERLEASKPIPAIDFYDDAIPKRIRVQRQYKR